MRNNGASDDIEAEFDEECDDVGELDMLPLPFLSNSSSSSHSSSNFFGLVLHLETFSFLFSVAFK